jgi:hypothetical protein
MSPPFSIAAPSSLYTTAQPDPASQNSTRTINGILMALVTNGTGTGRSEQRRRIGTQHATV